MYIFLVIQVDVVIQHEDRLGETPKIYKNYKIYLTNQGNIVTAYLVEQLINEKLLREDTSVSFYDENKDIYVYSFTVPKSPLDFTNPDSIHRFISGKFISEGEVSQTLKIKLRSKKKLIIQALIEEQREKYEEAEENEKGHGAANKGQK